MGCLQQICPVHSSLLSQGFAHDVLQTPSQQSSPAAVLHSWEAEHAVGQATTFGSMHRPVAASAGSARPSVVQHTCPALVLHSSDAPQAAGHRSAATQMACP